MRGSYGSSEGTKAGFESFESVLLLGDNAINCRLVVTAEEYSKTRVAYAVKQSSEIRTAEATTQPLEERTEKLE